MRFYLLATLGAATLTQAGCFNKVFSQYSFDLEKNSNAYWMADISDAVYITALSIPGTHNSMTYLLEEHPPLHCQNVNLEQQLEGGIRYIDVSGRLVGNDIHIYHGNTDTGFDLDWVINTAFDFLDDHPKEVIIMRLKKDTWGSGANEGFEKSIRYSVFSDSYLSRRAAERLYIPNEEGVFRVPTMGVLRGKVLIVQDFPTKPSGRYGLQWGSKDAVISDFKMIPGHFAMGHKWKHVKDAINTASTVKDAKLHITHSSVSVGTTPYKSAGGKDSNSLGMNDRLGQYLNDATVRRTGVVVMDFPGKDLITQIIQRNTEFRQPIDV
ncbi:uncharacterized protein BROUX77_001806 [Berkeleyomyces rouxiae]|uniref:uncharacterized protein n=1 Tax=Berkeleyomyces rouxiae TaxID=2035830 RepID=UPI003B76D965